MSDHGRQSRGRGARSPTVLPGRLVRRKGVCRCGPAAEQVQGFLVAAAGFGCVGEDRQARVGGEVEAVEAGADVADRWVVEVLDAAEVKADAVGVPAGAELVALGRELPDEI
jgi:hypothetical protein